MDFGYNYVTLKFKLKTQIKQAKRSLRTAVAKTKAQIKGERKGE